MMYMFNIWYIQLGRRGFGYGTIKSPNFDEFSEKERSTNDDNGGFKDNYYGFRGDFDENCFDV